MKAHLREHRQEESAGCTEKLHSTNSNRSTKLLHSTKLFHFHWVRFFSVTVLTAFHRSASFQNMGWAFLHEFEGVYGHVLSV